MTRHRGAAAAVLAVSAPLLTVGVVLTFPGTPRPVTPPAADGARVVPVTRTLLGCAPLTAPGGTKARTVVGLAPGGRSGGRTVVTVPGAPPRPVHLERGHLAGLSVPGPSAADVLASGRSAPGVFAARTGAGAGALAVAACPGPRAEWWFTGAGASLDHRSVLRLRNVDSSPAVVDLDVLGAHGSVDIARTRGLTLLPGRTRTVPLVAVAPRSTELGLHVTASRGRVVASVADVVRSGGHTGREELPPAAPPGRDLVLAGIPATAGRRTLVVLNPGDRQALVSLRVVTSEGAFVPRGLEELSLAPGESRTVDLTAAVGHLPASVRVRSDVDVTATVRSTLAEDEGDAVPALPLSGTAVVTTAGGRTTLQLVGRTGAVTLRWEAYSPAGQRVGGSGVVAPASGLVQWTVPASAAYVVLTPKSGEAYVAAVHTGGGLAVERPLELPTSVRRPVVRPYAGDRQSSGSGS
ncbi:MAG: hypothetical protein QOK15_3135 [Nocardioidaceae bacterium]|nr:hypothetical protein [Nocardioidaceae bacterium]